MKREGGREGGVKGENRGYGEGMTLRVRGDFKGGG